MKDDLRRRREQHLMYVRMGLRYTDRVERLAQEFGVSEGAIRSDEHRMDNWIDEIVNTASFEKKAAYLLYQHRAQSEAMEQLAQTANSERRRASNRADDQQEMLQEYKSASPESLGMDPDEYWSTLIDLSRQVDEAEEDVFKWAREERQDRQEIASEARQEFELRQSLGEIEQVADKLEVDMESTVEERKVFAGIDLSAMPGIDQARLIGAELDRADDADGEGDPAIEADGATIELEDGDDE